MITTNKGFAKSYLITRIHSYGHHDILLTYTYYILETPGPKLWLCYAANLTTFKTEVISSVHILREGICKFFQQSTRSPQWSYLKITI